MTTISSFPMSRSEQQIGDLVVSYMDDRENLEKTSTIFQQVMQQNIDGSERDFLKSEADACIVQHANHQLSAEDFLASLVRPDDRGGLPIYAVKGKSLLQVLELAKEKRFTFDAAIIDVLFNQYAASDEDSYALSNILLEIRPETIKQTIGRDISFYSQALLHQIDGMETKTFRSWRKSRSCFKMLTIFGCPTALSCLRQANPGHCAGERYRRQ